MVWSHILHSICRLFSVLCERHIYYVFFLPRHDGCAGMVNEELNTNVDQFLGIRKGKLIANRGHDSLLACIEIYITA
jgi:hypothetical protein